MSKWIKKDDKVVVIAGNSKGKTGTVLARIGDRVVVQGINIRKKHAKRKTKTAGSQVLEMEVPVHVSNVSICNSDGKAVKLKVKLDSKGGKELYYREGEKNISFRKINPKS